MTSVIKAEKLGKKYIIGHQKQRYHQTLRDVMTHTARGIWQRIRRPLSPNRESVNLEELWALKDINFEVQQGERIGIIGCNGAGKSTLLKILSRITEPTTGRAYTRGRVSSLLEVGTGFHPELTGRENIFLNGVILGMTRQEIKRKFDEIVAFAELEKFLDTPVKRYSSGMYVRLAFAVAAHLEPEILLVDEVLAVGDAAFQKKCLGKMDNVAKSGRTVLFVSHNLGAVRTLCNRAILLNNGTVSLCGHTNHIVAAYLKTLEEVACQNLLDRSDRRGFGDVRLTEVSVTVPGNPSSTALLVGRPGRFVFRFNKLLPMMSCRFTIVDQQGYKVVHFISGATCSNDTYDPSIGPMYICEVEELTLAPGRYGINVLVQTGSALQDYLEAAASFDVRPGVLGGRVISEETPCGAVCLGHRWTIGTLH